MRSEATKTVNETMEHEQSLERLRGTIAAREQDLAELQRKLGDQEDALAGLKQEVTQREQALGLLQESVGEYRESLSTLGSILVEQETILETLRTSQSTREFDAMAKTIQAQILADAAYDALFVLDDALNVVASNTSAEKLFNNPDPAGKPLVEVTGLPELSMLVEDAVANAEAIYEEQLSFQKRAYRVRVQMIQQGVTRYVALALQDVTELVRLNRARRDMVANISHELRTPIANIRLIIESLFHEQEKPKRKQSTTALKAVARETDSLLWLVQELLDLSMIESGQAILRMEETFAAEMVDEAIERVVDQSDAKEIEILNEVPVDFQVLADRDQVRRVLINLIHNSIKWSPPGEKIKVRAERAGDEVVMSVLDHGPGVPEEFRERIFERFYQVDPSRSVGEGTGLGLAICRHIIEAHGGSIWVVDNLEGKDGKGGCFEFTLPAAEETAEPESGDTPAS